MKLKIFVFKSEFYMGRIIMTVDDDAISRRVLSACLKKAGDYQVEEFDNAVAALEYLSENKVDLIITDIEMPDMDGFSFYEKLRSMEDLNKIPVLFLTGSFDEKNQERALSLSAAGFIRKPIILPDLKAVVERALNSFDIAESKDSILIIDDSSMTNRIAKHILEMKYKVYTATSGEEGLKMAEEIVPSLILLDIHMPNMNGFDVMNILKKNDKLKDIPVVFLTADIEKSSEVDSFKVGAQDYIRKPFIAEVMIQRVGRILELEHLKKYLQTEVEKQTRKAEERRKSMERMTDQIIKALVGTIDAKDKYTNGHSARVASYSREIARRAGKDEKMQQNIYYIGLLHDIGKIGIPDEIINKKSRLSEEEYNIIKTHPVIGSEILKNISEIPGIWQGARFHHERYDGKGYPDGLKGDDIPEVGRIIGVADAYDAMTSNRSYRPLLPQNLVREEIKNNMGTQFDPRFASIMLEMIDEDTDFSLHE